MHRVEKKVRDEIGPYLLTGMRLTRWWPFWVYLFYTYFAEVFVLLAGFGIANPVMAFLAGGQTSKTTTPSQAQSSVVDFLGSSTASMLAIGLLVIWGVLKFYVRQADLEKRCSLLRSCRLQCIQFSNRIRLVLAKPAPMQELLDIQAKLSDLVERNIIEGGWPYDGPEPAVLVRQKDLKREGEELPSLADKYCEQLVKLHRSTWENEPLAERPKPIEVNNQANPVISSELARRVQP